MRRAEDWTIKSPPGSPAEISAVRQIRTPEAIRERCTEILTACSIGGESCFNLNLPRLAEVADYVVREILRNYPQLDVPYHSRWRHFQAGGIDRWCLLARDLVEQPPEEVARIRIELAIISVLLDAGAGDVWHYQEPTTERCYVRSEGLALASLALYRSGTLSSRPAHPLRADASVICGLDAQALSTAFQIREDNPLLGVDGRLLLLRSLGNCIAGQTELFGTHPPRLGNLYDHLLAHSSNQRLAARDILIAILTIFSPIWPGRIQIGGENLGDVWGHPAIRRPDCTDQLVPFHKLSQWLTYSLVEPLEDSGLKVTGLDDLTGLAEYRNGGLFIDLGVLEPHSPVDTPVAVDSRLVVEWRALTVALLDRLAPMVREQLGVDQQQLPLAKILQGGTWSAGRRVAAERRAGATPPISLHSDGTVF